MKMERPLLSLMGVQSGEAYLIKIINKYSKYCDYLEDEIRGLCISEGMNPSKELMWLFDDEESLDV